jgi:RHS repeat-associated protein
MTDSSGTVVWAADYKPFGEATVTVSTITNNLRFPGQYFDAETGLNYNYFRDYDPATGRYKQADPIGLGGGINLYVYALNSPLMYIDPTGEDAAAGVTAEWVLGKIMEALIGARPSVTPNFNILWGEQCCCQGQTYRKKVTTVALRVRIGTMGNIDGGGKFSSCGPCEEDACFSLTGGFNISQFAISRMPVIGASLGRYLNDFGSIRVNATGQYCMKRGFTYLNVGASARFLYVGAASTNIRVY